MISSGPVQTASLRIVGAPRFRAPGVRAFTYGAADFRLDPGGRI